MIRDTMWLDANVVYTIYLYNNDFNLCWSCLMFPFNDAMNIPNISDSIYLCCFKFYIIQIYACIQNNFQCEVSANESLIKYTNSHEYIRQTLN